MDGAAAGCARTVTGPRKAAAIDARPMAIAARRTGGRERMRILLKGLDSPAAAYSTRRTTRGSMAQMGRERERASAMTDRSHGETTCTREIARPPREYRAALEKAWVPAFAEMSGGGCPRTRPRPNPSRTGGGLWICRRGR